MPLYGEAHSGVRLHNHARAPRSTSVARSGRSKCRLTTCWIGRVNH